MINRLSLIAAMIILIVAAGLLVYNTAAPITQAGAPAVTNAPQTTTDLGGISVTGNGRVRAKPNIATASIGVEITSGTLADAVAQANAKAAAITDKLKSLGVADKDIQTTNFSVSPMTQQPKDGSTPKITGYRVNNQLGVTIRKLDDAGKILDAVVAAGANNVYNISFGVDDATATQLNQQARAAAVKDAQDKASQLAKAANVNLGKLISLSEVSTSRPVYRDYAAAPMMAATAANEVPIQTGELEIVLNVEMKFAVQ
jgi:uncharacterized protein